MPRVKLNGDLAANVDNLFGLFDQILSASDADGIEFAGISPGGLFSLTARGPGLDVETSGSQFASGTVRNIMLESGLLGSNDPLLIFDQFKLNATKVYDLIKREEDGIFVRTFGTLDNKGVKSFLNNNDWKIVGGDLGDTVSVSNKMTLAGDDEIFGKGGADVLSGGAGADVISGGKGVDQLFGQRGNDKLLGDGGADLLNGGTGKDKLNGGDDADRMFGGDDGDRLTGERGADVLFGGQGVDVLIGGNGDDVMSGGRGADQFVFKKGHDDDIIRGFDVGVDVLVFDNPQQVRRTQDGDDAVFDYVGGSVTLRGVDINDLSRDGEFWT